MYRQILDAINQGIVILGSEYTVIYWNRWMDVHSGIHKEQIIGTCIFEQYPDLNNPNFIRNCKSVLNFGNYIFYSQKLHNYMFPFKTIGTYALKHEMMQQSCVMAPLRVEDSSIKEIVITIQDVTESVYLENELKTMIQYDSLTGIHNRRYFDERLVEEFNRTIRNKLDLALIIFDIDNFKKLNDNYGHQYGDAVLQKIAQVCKKVIRGCDIFARYGGEEFCVILPDSNIKGAGVFAERLRLAVENMEVDYQNREEKVYETVTISLGVSAIDLNISTEAQLLKCADEALYNSKHTGKNCVSFYKN